MSIKAGAPLKDAAFRFRVLKSFQPGNGCLTAPRRRPETPTSDREVRGQVFAAERSVEHLDRQRLGGLRCSAELHLGGLVDHVVGSLCSGCTMRLRYRP